MKRDRPIIRSSQDFLKYHYTRAIFCRKNENGYFFVAPTYDLYSSVDYYYDLGSTCKQRCEVEREINDYLNKHLHYFDIEHSRDFYYPSTSGSSLDNGQRGIEGYILRYKDEYIPLTPSYYRVTFMVDVNYDAPWITNEKAAIEQAILRLSEAYSPDYTRVKKVYFTEER